MNKVIFIGRLTKDVELKTIGDNTVCNFTLARNRSYQKDKDHPEADFIDFVAWNKSAEFLSKYFSKGDKVGIEGFLQTGSFEGKSGDNIKTTKVVVERIEFVDSKKTGSTTSSDTSSTTTTSTENKTETNESSGSEDDYPF